MPAFRIAINLDHLIPPDSPLDLATFPNLGQAVQQMAEAAMARWQGYASGEPLPNGEIIRVRSGTYLRSIQLRELGDFAREVYSDLSYADAIEQGQPPRDLKDMLNTSMKVRVSKSGKRYLIIPFRHGIPGTVGMRSTMTPEIHQMAKRMTGSRVTGMGQRTSGTGAYDPRTKKPYLVPKREYAWGGRMSKQSLHAAGASSQQVRHMAGMVKMQNPTSKGSRDTQYLTFRVMTEDSPGWRTKAIPGKYPARTTAEQLRPVAERAFADAVKQDLARFMGGINI